MKRRQLLRIAAFPPAVSLLALGIACAGLRPLFALPVPLRFNAQVADAGRTTLGRITNPPPEIRPEWAPLVGEYLHGREKFYVLERGGALGLLRPKGAFIVLRPVEPNRLAGQFEALEDAGKQGRARGETAVFQRSSSGAVTGLTLENVTYAKTIENRPGQVFQITPLKPVDQLRREAMASQPPVERGKFLAPDLVNLGKLDPTFKFEIRYATSRNFLGAPLYLEPRAFLQRPAAEALVRASQRLHSFGYGLLIFDAYRPWYVTRMFWDGTPDDKKIFVADPKAGSRHNRGCAVDLTLYDLKTGREVPMTGGYDEMSERSYPNFPGGTSLERWHRDLLRRVMEAEGFRVQRVEWWHFDYQGWKRYPILNLSFEQLDRQGR